MTLAFISGFRPAERAAEPATVVAGHRVPTSPVDLVSGPAVYTLPPVAIKPSAPVILAISKTMIASPVRRVAIRETVRA